MNSAISIVLSKELKEKIKELAKKKNISQNALVRLAISEYIERNEWHD